MPTVVISQSGQKGLPIQVQFTPYSTMPSLIFFCGSVWSNDNGMMMGLKLSIAGKEICRTQIFSNIVGQHRTTTPVMVKADIPFELDDKKNPKPVTFTVDKIDDKTNFDENDYVNVTVF